MKRTLIFLTILALLCGCNSEISRLEARTDLVEAQEDLTQADDVQETSETWAKIVALLIQELGEERDIARDGWNDLIDLLEQQQKPDRTWLWVLAAATFLAAIYLWRRPREKPILVYAPPQDLLDHPGRPSIGAGEYKPPIGQPYSIRISQPEDVVIE